MKVLSGVYPYGSYSGDIVIDEILLVEFDQERNLVEVVVHGR